MTNVENILNTLSEAVFVLDKEARIVFFNQTSNRFQHLTRMPIQLGVQFPKLVSAEREEVVRTILRQVRDHNITETVEAEYKSPEGRPYFFEVTYSPVIGNDQINFCVEARDITPQKTFERKAVRMLRDYQNILENANTMIFSVDSREYITDWNKECTRVTHYEKNEILTHRVITLADESNQEQMRYLMERVLVGKPVHNYELIIKDKSDGRFTLLVNVTPKLNDKGDVIGALFMGQDITELSGYRYSLEQQVLDRTQKLKIALEKERELVAIKNRFVSMASHELRTPLSSIEHAVSLMRSTGIPPQKEFNALEKIDRQVDVMKNLLEDILILEKGDTQKLKASYQSFDLIAFLNELVDEVMISRKHSHTVVKKISHPFVSMVCDNKLLRNIFINLLTNAMKFSPAQDKIEMTITLRENGGVEVTIQDNGIGITQEDQKRIFDPFTRGANTENIKGTGLGLSIVKRAVETLNGTLTLESTIHKGTSITVWLPSSPNPVSK